ncbi:hypothetical protein [Paenibacillus sp. BC26]|uniref:hypothetical protein n=1 Tax=Paenibacillus sp. BC26 TaxID=1881032 RepID=UPI0008E9AF6D|nr:hypothetical protein [Paenibacillus sp. BC26]SFT09581.1 hypothetical protein SAMN05428962_4349 [Paenibacillus sp. BC26]
MIRWRLLLAIGLVMITGCGNGGNSGVHASNESVADYIDFGDKRYLNAWELSLLESTKIDKIGVVERGSRISGNNAVYEIEGYPDRDVVAVQDDSAAIATIENRTGYSIYVLFEGADQPSHDPNLLDLPVEKVNIYRGTRLLHTYEGEDVRTIQRLLDQKGPDNEFRTDAAARLTVLFITANTLGYNYGITEKDGAYGLAHRESKLPADIARFFAE